MADFNTTRAKREHHNAEIARMEDYERANIPAWVVTAGVDVQRDRPKARVVPWGQGEEVWVLEHVILAGDNAQTDVWAHLHQVFAEHNPDAAAIDSGFNSSVVYAFVEMHRLSDALSRRPQQPGAVHIDSRQRALNMIELFNQRRRQQIRPPYSL